MTAERENPLSTSTLRTTMWVENIVALVTFVDRDGHAPFYNICYTRFPELDNFFYDTYRRAPQKKQAFVLVALLGAGVVI